MTDNTTHYPSLPDNIHRDDTSNTTFIFEAENIQDKWNGKWQQRGVLARKIILAAHALKPLPASHCAVINDNGHKTITISAELCGKVYEAYQEIFYIARNLLSLEKEPAPAQKRDTYKKLHNRIKDIHDILEYDEAWLTKVYYGAAKDDNIYRVLDDETEYLWENRGFIEGNPDVPSVMMKAVADFKDIIDLFHKMDQYVDRINIDDYRYGNELEQSKQMLAGRRYDLAEAIAIFLWQECFGHKISSSKNPPSRKTCNNTKPFGVLPEFIVHVFDILKQDPCLEEHSTLWLRVSDSDFANFAEKIQDKLKKNRGFIQNLGSRGKHGYKILD